MDFLLFISVFFIVGFGVTSWSVYCIFKSLKAANWPIVFGILNSCELIEKWDDGPSWQVIVNYSYLIEGQLYQGNRISFGYFATSVRGPHSSIFEKIKTAKELKVRYNPLKPSEAVLTFGTSKDNLIGLAWGVTFVLFSVGFTALKYLSEMTEKPVDILTIVSILTAFILIAGIVLMTILIRQTDSLLLERIETKS